MCPHTLITKAIRRVPVLQQWDLRIHPQYKYDLGLLLTKLRFLLSQSCLSHGLGCCGSLLQNGINLINSTSTRKCDQDNAETTIEWQWGKTHLPQIQLISPSSNYWQQLIAPVLFLALLIDRQNPDVYHSPGNTGVWLVSWWYRSNQVNHLLPVQLLRLIANWRNSREQVNGYFERKYSWPWAEWLEDSCPEVDGRGTEPGNYQNKLFTFYSDPYAILPWSVGEWGVIEAIGS